MRSGLASARRLDPEQRSAGIDRLVRWKHWRAVAWCAFSLVGIASILPGSIEFRTRAPPELEHVFAYAVTGGIFAVVYGRKGAPLSAALLIIGAVGFELAQFWIPGRTPRVVDAACSIAGSMIGLAAGLVLRRAWSKRYRVSK